MVRLVRAAHIGLILASVSISVAWAEAPFKLATTPGRLSKSVVPKSYQIDLVPDVEALTFTGHETIAIDVAATTDTIILDADGLTLTEAHVAGEATGPAVIALDEAATTATLHFPHALAAGHHVLDIAWSGVIGPQPAGLYYNDFAGPGGKQRMLITQFEAISARKMFPGWDEPAFKATFHLSVVLPHDFAAISNTPITATAPAGSDAKGGALKKVTFGQTPKMSSYLLVLAAGPLERIIGASDDTEIGVWAGAGKAGQGAYALHSAEQILHYYNDYFGIKYPLPKMDMIAVPGNFAAGAMENWGGLTYIDNLLLFDPALSSLETKQNIYLVVAHEMAHQWSGDLVTMAWWNNTWLNEGFASWMQYKPTDHFNPDWEVWMNVHGTREKAMEFDARPSTHAIQQAIPDESEIGRVFDSISYQKGGAVIRMIESYLGEDVFRAGMRSYMKAHQYSNTTTADLWAALEAASGKPVAAIAAGFTEQPGIPLVDVASHCVGGKTLVSLSETRFTLHDPNAAKLTWQVPVRLGVIGGKPLYTLLGPSPQEIALPGCGQPVKANFGDVGYYRTAYAPADLAALTADYKALAPLDRANLVGDQWALVQAGRSDLAGYFALLGQLGAEDEHGVWTSVISALRRIDDLERGAPERAAFRTYASGLLRPVLDRLGWVAKPGESSGATLLRAEVIVALGRFDDAAVIAEARRRFGEFPQDPSALPPTIIDAVLNVVGRHADAASYARLRALGRDASGTEAKLRYYYALAGARDPSLIDQNVQIGLTDEISNGRVNRFLARAAAESDDPDRVWRSLLPVVEPILKKLPRASDLLPSIAGPSSNPAIADELVARPESTATSGARIAAAAASEEIGARVELKQRLVPAVAEWLRTR